MNNRAMIKAIKRAQEVIDSIAKDCVSKCMVAESSEALKISMDLQAVINELRGPRHANNDDYSTTGRHDGTRKT